MATTYYVPRTAEGEDIPSQQEKLGTPAYGFRTPHEAMRHVPEGGYVEERHHADGSDWGGRLYWPGDVTPE